MKRILLLEDDLSLGETIKELLLENDYEVDYVIFDNELSGIQIRNLEEYFDNDLLNYVSGIVNGTTNYILTKMAKWSRNREHMNWK